MSLGQDQAREGTAPTVQTPHCSTTPHTASYTEPLHSQGKDEEGSSLWGINRLEYGSTVKAAVGKILACCRTSVRQREVFPALRRSALYFILWMWCRSSYNRWGMVGAIHILHAQIFHKLIFFYSHSYPYSLQKWLELKYNVSNLDLGPVLPRSLEI